MAQNNGEDYIEKICAVQYDALLIENQFVLDEYVDFCSTQQILSIFDFNNKQLHLFGRSISIKEAGRILYLIIIRYMNR
jgi:hypothetical protein